MLEEAGAQYERHRVDTKNNQQRLPEYLKLNPKAVAHTHLTMPTTLTEGPAIMGYIAQTYPVLCPRRLFAGVPHCP